jgi:hypothetical protein
VCQARGAVRTTREYDRKRSCRSRGERFTPEP